MSNNILHCIGEFIEMKEEFAKPAVRAIIEHEINGEKYILMQERQKENSLNTNGLLELPGGKIRKYENIFDALKREVFEETGLTITHSCIPSNSYHNITSGCETIGFLPFCITQNLNKCYSLIVLTFICQATGDLLTETNESCNIHWKKIDDLKQQIKEMPQLFFPLDIISLSKYIQEFFSK